LPCSFALVFAKALEKGVSEEMALVRRPLYRACFQPQEKNPNTFLAETKQ
jgi:hypothetical protein